MTDDLLRLMHLLKLRQQTTYNKSLWQKIGNHHFCISYIHIENCVILGNWPAVFSILITLTLIALNIFSGTLIVLTYTETIFTNFGPALFQAKTSAIVVAVVQVFSVYIASQVVDKIGRRYLLLISCVGTAMTAMALFGFALASKDPKSRVFYVFPLICMCLFLFMTSIGIVPVSFIAIAEILPYEVMTIL